MAVRRQIEFRPSIKDILKQWKKKEKKGYEYNGFQAVHPITDCQEFECPL